jgi:hypothetical protein
MSTEPTEARRRTAEIYAAYRGVLSCLLAAVLALAPVGSAARAQGLGQSPRAQGAQGPGAQIMTRADYEACQAGDDAKFRAAIEVITVKALQRGVANIDFRAVVDDEWRRGGLDEIIDKRVDIAVAEVREETSWGRLIQSLANKDKAQELATTVAERVYRSDAVKAGIEALAEGVARAIGKQVELATIDAAQPATQCLQAFLGPRYGATVARLMTSGAEKEFLDPGKASATIGTGAVLTESGEGIAGAIVLLVRRQLANMASRVGQRIVGSVLSRLVSVVAGGVGVVLIAKEIWDFRHGVMPIIAGEMKSRDTKDKVKDELARTIAEQINEHLREIGAKTAERIVDLWQEFRRAHAKVLDLAERNEVFRRFVDTTRADNLPRLDEMVGLLLGEESEAGVLKRLADGTLHQIVNIAPPASLQIARETRSVDNALKWTALAGNALPKVIEHELHRRTRPDSFSAATLSRILALDDKIAVSRLAALTPAARATLFELDGAELRTLSRALAETELDTLASYLTGLAAAPRERILKAVAQSPGRMQILASARVRDAIIGSRDQTAAVAMMLRPSTGLDIPRLQEDFRQVLDGRVQPLLLWDRHPIAVSALGVLALIMLLMVRRLFSGGRRRAAQPQG